MTDYNDLTQLTLFVIENAGKLLVFNSPPNRTAILNGAGEPMVFDMLFLSSFSVYLSLENKNDYSMRPM